MRHRSRLAEQLAPRLLTELDLRHRQSHAPNTYDVLDTMLKPPSGWPAWKGHRGSAATLKVSTRTAAKGDRKVSADISLMLRHGTSAWEHGLELSMKLLAQVEAPPGTTESKLKLFFQGWLEEQGAQVTYLNASDPKDLELNKRSDTLWSLWLVIESAPTVAFSTASGVANDRDHSAKALSKAKSMVHEVDKVVTEFIADFIGDNALIYAAPALVPSNG